MDGKIYIGAHSTNDLDDDYFGSGKHLKRAIKKYGQESFEKTYIGFFNSMEEMFEHEAKIVNEEFVSRADTYNLTIGGDDGLIYLNKTGKNHLHDNRENSLKNLEKGTEARRKKLADPEFQKILPKLISEGLKKHYENNPYHFTGKKHTEETKRKIGGAASKHQKGKGNSQYGTMWITDGLANRKIKKDGTIPSGWTRGRTVS